MPTTVNESWNGATADWNTPADWSSPSIVPNDTSTDIYDVTLGGTSAYTVTISPDESFTVGTLLISDAAANLGLHNGASLSVTGTFSNAGTLGVDNYNNNFGSFDAGGSSLAIGSTLSNSGTVDIGNTGLSVATTVSATGLSNTGTINLTGSGTTQAALKIAGAAPATLGDFNIYGDALVQFGSGAVTSNAAGITLSLRDDPTPISLNAGVSTTGTFSNAGTLGVDNYNNNFGSFDAGGSSLAIGSTLSNSGTVDIGNTGLSVATTVSATGLSNTGTINLTGSGTTQAALKIAGAAPATLGDFNIYGDALVQFGSGAVTSNAAGITLSLRDDPTPISLNAGVSTTGTFSNAGTLGVDNYNNNFGSFDAGGSSLAIGSTLSNSGTVDIGNTGLSVATTVSATGLSNTGTINLTGSGTTQAALKIAGAAPATLGDFNIYGDALVQFGSGAVTSNAAGITLSLRDDPTPISLNAGVSTTGTFSNAGTLGVDNYNNNFGSFDAGGSSLAIGSTLSNSGTVDIGNTGLSVATTVSATGLSNTGTINLTGSGTTQAALKIAGAAPATLGDFNIYGDALVQFGSGAVTSNAAGITLSLRDDPTPISLNAGVSTTGTFSNAGTLGVDNYNNNFGSFDAGGSSLAIGSTLSNSGTVDIGNTGLSVATTVSATGLSNTGTINLTGSGTTQAALKIAGAAPATLGDFNIYGDALVQFGSGAVTSNAAGITLSLRDDPTPISLNAGVSTTGTFSNAGTLGVDNYNNNFGSFDAGGSSLAIGSTLSNSGTVDIGNTGLSVATTVSATGLSNTGTINLSGGSAADTATLTVTGPASNSGTIDVGSFSVLDVTGGNAFMQTGGTTTVDGTLTAATIDIDGGTLVFNTNNFTNTGTLGAADGGVINFSAGGLTNLSGTTLTGGIYVVDAGSMLQLPNNTTIVTLAADLTLSGAGSVVESLDTGTSAQVPIETTLTTIAAGGALRVLGGRDYTTTNPIADGGLLQLGGGTFSAASLTVTGNGTVSGSGTINERLIVDPGAVFQGTLDGNGSNTIELAGSTQGVLNGLGTTLSDFAAVTVDAGATWTVDALASALSGITITGSGGSNILAITSSGAANLSGVSGFPTIRLSATGANTLTLTNANFTGVTGSSITVRGGNDGDTVDAAALSAPNRVIVIGGAGTDAFTGGAGNDIFEFTAADLTAADTVTGGPGSNELYITSAGTVAAGGVSGVETYVLANGGASSLTLTNANFTGVTGSSITVRAGNDGDTVDAAALSAPNRVIVIGGAGTDAFTGGAGNDIFEFSAANLTATDTIIGGGGTDELLMTSAGTVAASGVSGVETYVLANGGASSLTLTNANFAGITGASITVRGGNDGDTVDAAALSAPNRVIVIGGPGEEVLTGGAGNDIFEFTAANLKATDTIIGGGGTDELLMTTAGTVAAGGASGVETYRLASGGANILTLTNANFAGVPGSSITVYDGNDGNTVNASAVTGSNRIVVVGGTGTDVLIGGAGDDIFEFSAANLAATDTILGGGGANELLMTTAGTVAAGGVSGVEVYHLANGGADSLTLTNANFAGVTGASITVVDGNDGNTVDASAVTGSNRIIVVGGPGAEVLTGGAGNDIFEFTAADLAAADTIVGGGGTNELLTTTAGTVAAGGVSGVEVYHLANGGANSLTLTNANFAGVAGASITVVDGNDGNTVNASALSAPNRVVVVGGPGAEALTGGAGNDIFEFTAANLAATDTIAGGAGTDSLVFTTTGRIAAAAFSHVSGIEVIRLANGTNSLTLSNAVVAASDNQRLTIEGGTGNDAINAAAVLAGNTVVFNGEGGNDSIVGGRGANLYEFNNEPGTLDIGNAFIGGTAAHGGLEFGSGITDQDLWFVQSGTNLVAEVIGTSEAVTVNGWFGTNASAQVSEIEAGGLKLDSQVAQLVSAMATYSTNNPTYNPTSSGAAMPTDPTLQSAIASAWHS